MGAPYQGYANLGEAIFGRGNRQEAYNRGATEAAQLELLLARARQEVDQARARQEFSQNIARYLPENIAGIADSAFRANYDLAKLGEYRLGDQRFTLTDEAAGLARGGNVDAMNNLLTVINGSPRVRTNITQGMAFDPYAAPQQQMQTTPVGLADIAATAALGRQRDAAAAESYAGASADQALAGLRSRTDPNLRSGGGSGGGAQTGGSLSADTMAMFSRPNPLDPTGKPQLDPEMYQQFLQWRMSAGANGNINEDARRWLATRIQTGSDVGGLGGVASEVGGLARIAQRLAAEMPAAPVAAPPPQAVQLLRSNPSLAPQFEQKYGPGSASRYLGR
jgi:hypothetical protein